MSLPPPEPWLRDLERTGNRLTATVGLDATAPYLDHHRPNGEPLFGTVMGIEVMVAAAKSLLGAPHITSVEGIENYPPYFATAAAPALRVAAELRMRADEAAVVDARVVSAAVDGEREHFRSRLFLQPLPGLVGVSLGASAGFSAGDAPATLRHYADAICAAEIYTVYFHGPAFRVLAGAAWRDGRLYARAASALPGLWGNAASQPGECDTARDHAAPRIIEFALQSAGLHALALGDQLLVPHRIDRIRWKPGATDVNGAALLSVVSRSAEARIDRCATPAALDVSVYDACGDTVLRVEGYETVPLPFTRDAAPLRALGQRLRAGVPSR